MKPIARQRELHERQANPPDIPPLGHAEFLRKCEHVRRLLVMLDVADKNCEAASAWVLALADDADPTFCVREWIEAGWRDPLLVNVALRVCSTREVAESCMSWLGKDVADKYSHTSIAELSHAMIVLAPILEPANDR